VKRKEKRNQTPLEGKHCNTIPKIYGNHKKNTSRSRDIKTPLPPLCPSRAQAINSNYHKHPLRTARRRLQSQEKNEA
jgi:hypothetical protein